MVEKNSKEMAKIAVAALEEKKAKDIKILDISVHIFDEENRLFYDLERIWRDGSLVEKADLEA